MHSMSACKGVVHGDSQRMNCGTDGCGVDRSTGQESGSVRNNLLLASSGRRRVSKLFGFGKNWVGVGWA
jgi:hypothetical protein